MRRAAIPTRRREPRALRSEFRRQKTREPAMQVPPLMALPAGQSIALRNPVIALLNLAWMDRARPPTAALVPAPKSFPESFPPSPAPDTLPFRDFVPEP